MSTCVLALDIDGVLNSAAFFARQRGAGLVVFGSFVEVIDPDAVAHLNRIVTATGCEVVVSSSWRWNLTVGQIEEALRQRGFVGHLVGRTLTRRDGVRGREIADWLADRGIPRERAVVLDDCTLGGGMEDRLVRTTYADGLTAAHADRAIGMLGG